MIKKKQKQIPAKNYIILACLFVGTIFLLLFITEKYEAYKEYEKQTPVIRDTLPEIGYTEVDHYITENPYVVLYMCTASDEVCRDFEKDLKKVVLKDGLSNSITYVNLSDIDSNQFVDEFNNKYPYKKALTTSYPAFVILRDTEVVDILQGSSDKPLTISKAEAFFEYYEVGDVNE